MEKFKLFVLLCFSMLIFFVGPVQAIDKEVIEKVKKSVVLLSVNKIKDPPSTSPNSLCSGTSINENGNILTNFHCVYGQETINLYYWDEDDWTEYQVKVIGKDPLADLALLEVIGLERKVPYLTFAKESDIHTGLEIFAFGHPMGMVWSLSKGIISNDERYARHPYIKSIQVDAAINKGNSGGPLINEKGEIVGVASLMVSRSNQNAGVGLGIRADIAEKSLTEMFLTGKVDRPALGVMVIALFGKDNQREKILKDNPGINTTIPNSFGLMISDQNKPTNPIPEGLKAWDTIIGINDVPINTDIEFAEELIKYKIGEKIHVNIIRDKRFMKIGNITLKVFPVPTDKMYSTDPLLNVPKTQKN
jgi:serine protease Do